MKRATRELTLLRSFSQSQPFVNPLSALQDEYGFNEQRMDWISPDALRFSTEGTTNITAQLLELTRKSDGNFPTLGGQCLSDTQVTERTLKAKVRQSIINPLLRSSTLDSSSTPRYLLDIQNSNNAALPLRVQSATRKITLFEVQQLSIKMLPTRSNLRKSTTRYLSTPSSPKQLQGESSSFFSSTL